MWWKRIPEYLFILVLCCCSFQANSQQFPARTVPDSVTAGYKRDRAYEYANDSAYWKQEVPRKNDSAFDKFFTRLFNPKTWKLIGYTFLVVMFCFIIYQLFANGVFYANRRSRGEVQDLGQDITVQNEQDLLALLPQLEQDQRFREAIRVQYLLLLKHLERNSNLALDARSTNVDYLQQLAGKSIREPFRQLLRIYEYAWFGEVQVARNDYAYAKNQFTEFKQRY